HRAHGRLVQVVPGAGDPLRQAGRQLRRPVDRRQHPIPPPELPGCPRSLIVRNDLAWRGGSVRLPPSGRSRPRTGCSRAGAAPRSAAAPTGAAAPPGYLGPPLASTLGQPQVTGAAARAGRLAGHLAPTDSHFQGRRNPVAALLAAGWLVAGLAA